MRDPVDMAVGAGGTTAMAASDVVGRPSAHPPGASDAAIAPAEDLLVLAARIRRHPRHALPKNLHSMSAGLRIYLERWVAEGVVARLFECCGRLAEESVV